MFLEGYRNEGRNERNWCDVRPWAPHSRQPSAPQYSTQSCFEASFFFFIGLLFVLFLAPSLPVVTDEHNARKIYSNSCPHKRKKTKLLSARCADSKNIFLSIEQNSKFAHIQKEKKTTLQLLIVWVWGLLWSIVWRRQMSMFHHAVINRSFNGVNDDFVCVPLF